MDVGLAQVEKNVELGARIASIHETLREQFPNICRISVVTYDRETDLLKTFVNSTQGPSPLVYYTSKLANSKSLVDIAAHGQPRIINNLQDQPGNGRHHTEAIKKSGYGSSLTYPIYHGDRFFGFLFFNADTADFFSGVVVKSLSVYTQLISALVLNERQPIDTLKAVVKTAREFSRQRDEETDKHLKRMAHYTRIIAIEVGADNGLDDVDIEHLFQFVPLHDVGKVAIADTILLKEDKLTEDEFKLMMEHVSKGAEIVDTMVNGFRLGSVPHIKMLKNIVSYHHEALDGSGYPKGLKGKDIPIEARITSAADIFDALTSRRPYKKAWENKDAFEYLRKLAGTKLDPECVEALIKNEAQIEVIQGKFSEDDFE